jgi:hypothetical protein
VKNSKRVRRVVVSVEDPLPTGLRDALAPDHLTRQYAPAWPESGGRRHGAFGVDLTGALSRIPSRQGTSVHPPVSQPMIGSLMHLQGLSEH